MKLKEELSRKSDSKVNLECFDVCLKCRSDPWIKNMEKCEKTHILGIPECLLPVELESYR